MTHFTVAPASRIHATIHSWHSTLAFHHDVQVHRPRHQSLRPLQIKFHLRQIGNILICGEVHGGIDQTWKRFNMSLFHRVDEPMHKVTSLVWSYLILFVYLPHVWTLKRGMQAFHCVRLVSCPWKVGSQNMSKSKLCNPTNFTTCGCRSLSREPLPCRFGLASYRPNILDLSSLPLDAGKEPMNVNRKQGQPLSTWGSRAAFFGKPLHTKWNVPTIKTM